MWDTDLVTVGWSTQSFNGPLYEELSCEVFYASNISIHMIISSILLYTHRIYLGHCSQDRICYWQVGDAKEFKVATLQKIGMQQFKNLLFLFATQEWNIGWANWKWGPCDTCLESESEDGWKLKSQAGHHEAPAGVLFVLAEADWKPILLYRSPQPLPLSCDLMQEQSKCGI